MDLLIHEHKLCWTVLLLLFQIVFCIVKVIFLLKKGSVPHQAVSTRCGNKTPKSLFPLAEPPPNLLHYTWKCQASCPASFCFVINCHPIPPLVFAQCLCFFTFLVLLTFWLRSFFFPIYVTTHHCGVACSLLILKVLYCGNRLMKPPMEDMLSADRAIDFNSSCCVFVFL